jgi:hypothetical protein
MAYRHRDHMITRRKSLIRALRLLSGYRVQEGEASALDIHGSHSMLLHASMKATGKEVTRPLKGSATKLSVVFMIAASTTAWASDSTVNVLYAGLLVNLMERSVGPAFGQKGGDRFQGYAGGSNKLANEIKGKLRRGYGFVSANPKENNQLMGSPKGTGYVGTSALPSRRW